MKRKILSIIELITIIVCLIFGVLWIKYPEGIYDALFSVAGFVFIITEVYRRYWHKYFKTQPNEKDLQLFEEFTSLFSKNDIIRFYKEHDFLASFDEKYLLPLNSFIENWDNAAHEFIENDLEQEKKKLYKAAYSLGSIIAEKTVPIRNDYISVKPDRLPAGPTPEWVIRDAKEINELVPLFVECHERFIKLGRRRLY